MTFQLDTSGRVDCADDDRFDIGFEDLLPFAQGYVEALFAGLIDMGHGSECHNGWLGLGFSDLAPETLARIIADCEAIQSSGYCWVNTKDGGACFWSDRQAGRHIGPVFPPLTVQLGEDGKVRFA